MNASRPRPHLRVVITRSPDTGNDCCLSSNSTDSSSARIDPIEQRNRPSLSSLLNRAAAWYWRDPIAAERHRIEVDVMRLGGRVEWK